MRVPSLISFDIVMHFLEYTLYAYAHAYPMHSLYALLCRMPHYAICYTGLLLICRFVSYCIQLLSGSLGYCNEYNVL
jgi:hypothetical protein